MENEICDEIKKYTKSCGLYHRQSDTWNMNMILQFANWQWKKKKKIQRDSPVLNYS